jgi:hypothetical protein
VRWGCLQFSIDRIEDGRQIPRHIIIPKADDAIAMGCEFRSALFVRGGDLIGVLAAIQFDDELLFWASEVGDAIADRVLAAEFVEREAVAKGAPENLFRVG